jgi:BCD family chlorophyll transporter-like MFS transporter
MTRTSKHMPDTPAEPNLPLARILQLGLLFLAQGLLSLLLLGVMNRVMLDQTLLAIPATVGTACLSVRFYVAFVRVYLGQLTDSRRFLGYQRTGYIRVALPLAALALFAAVQVMWQLGQTGALMWALLLGLILGLYGVFLFTVTVAGMALVYDIAPAHDRSRVIGMVWAMMLMGFVIGGGLGRKLLDGVTLDNLEPSIDRFFGIMLVAVLVLGFAGTWGIERRFSLRRQRLGGVSPPYVGFAAAVRLFVKNRQSTRFFAFLFLVTLGVFMQQPVLEPYGGEVFAMTIAETTQLNMIWGGATLIALIAAGFTLSKRLGPWRTTRVGLAICALGFVGIFGAGLFGESGVFLFQVAVFVMGAGGGIAVNSMLGLMLGLAPAAHAGLYLGTFGLAQYLSQGLSLQVSGVLVDLGRGVFGSPAAAYGVVFVLEALLLVGSIVFLWHIERTSGIVPVRVSATDMMEAAD